MERLKKVIVFGVIPILIGILLYVNAGLQAEKYKDQTADLKQYNARITAEVASIKAKPNEIAEVPVVVKNLGTMAWMKSENNSISLSYHILSEDNKIIINDGERTTLANHVKSGEETKLNAVVQAPEEVGTYYIEFDMVHENVTWFKEKGSETLKIKLEVN